MPSRGQGRDNSICSAREYRGQGRDNTEDKIGGSQGGHLNGSGLAEFAIRSWEVSQSGDGVIDRPIWDYAYFLIFKKCNKKHPQLS